MAPRVKRILNFRIPFFRIFYSTTYTVLFLICLLLLAITPGTMIWRSFRRDAYQYIIMIGGVYFLTAVTAIFVYSSRLYTNRTTMAGVGKAYIPIEEDELGKSLWKMVEKQLQRSAVIAWEAKPRDLVDEVRREEADAISSPVSEEKASDDHRVGSIISVDPKNPPWGIVRHDGWSSPSVSDQNQTPHVCYTNVIEELPNILEAKAITLVPLIADPNSEEGAIADPAVLDLLSRPETMDMSMYITQLSYLGLIHPVETGRTFLQRYQQARFSGRPASDKDFHELMQLFTQLIEAMNHLDAEIIDQIRAQTYESRSGSPSIRSEQYDVVSRAGTQSTRSLSPVTARTRVSRNTTPYFTYDSQSDLSFTSVIGQDHGEAVMSAPRNESRTDSLSLNSGSHFESDAGSVIWRNDLH